MFRAVLFPFPQIRAGLWHRRYLATKAEPKIEGDEKDFRPPWVYTTSRIISYTVIPTIAFYSIFIYDFGDREHVFQPIRRWATRQKAAFFTLSPEEEKMLASEVEKQVPSTQPAVRLRVNS